MDLAQEISAIGMTSEPEAPPAEQPTPEAPAEGQPPAQEPAPAAPETPDPLKEIDLLKRVIATDPNMRDRYVAEKLGVPYAPQPQYAPPQQQPVQQPQAPQPVALPFDPADYDPTNAEHQYALMNHTIQTQLSQALAPFGQFIQQQQQENQQFAQQREQAQIRDLESQTRTAMDQHLPGFSEMATSLEQGKASVDQRFLLNAAYSEFDQELKRSYPQHFWRDPRIQQEVIRTIAPTIKTLADKLGVSSAAPTPQAQPAKPTAYVEPSTAVPQVKANAFDKAYQGFKKGDSKSLNGMISAIGRTV